MIKSGLSYVKWAPIAAVLAIAVITSMRSSTAKNQPMPMLAGVDLANEERVIGAYSDDFTTYETQRVELSKRASLVAADIEPLRRKSDDLRAQANEISDPLDKLRKKLTSYYNNGSSGQIVRAAYAEPAPFNLTHLGCGIAKVRAGVAIKVGGSPTSSTVEKVYNRCGPTNRETQE